MANDIKYQKGAHYAGFINLYNLPIQIKSVANKIQDFKKDVKEVSS
jgi:hypothetical protein